MPQWKTRALMGRPLMGAGKRTRSFAGRKATAWFQIAWFQMDDDAMGCSRERKEDIC
jgi:hypothetical protein